MSPGLLRFRLFHFCSFPKDKGGEGAGVSRPARISTPPFLSLNTNRKDSFDIYEVPFTFLRAQEQKPRAAKQVKDRRGRWNCFKLFAQGAQWEESYFQACSRAHFPSASPKAMIRWLSTVTNYFQVGKSRNGISLVPLGSREILYVGAGFCFLETPLRINHGFPERLKNWDIVSCGVGGRRIIYSLDTDLSCGDWTFVIKSGCDQQQTYLAGA